ncbi:MAG: accessory factor UbiK family protein [Rugosibacter sp.]|jgi:BMFP domain-containing protein YqiC|nr:accessory factor UbiK family protein [Rugosibacter sp.]MDO9272360.1 accessory factor UbiK family protein [Rugosibacter sp.]
MLNPKIFEEVSSRIAAAMAASPVGDVEKNARALLASFFAKLDLVTREEFDVQREVLSRTSAKLAALEQRVAELEAARAGEQK